MITARVGNVPGKSFRLKVVGGSTHGLAHVVTEDPRDNILDIEIATFTRAALAFGGKTSLRTFVLEPGEHDEFVFGPFFIRGTYRVVEKINNPAEASRRFREFM